LPLKTALALQGSLSIIIDYSQYTFEDLLDVKVNIDKDKYPENFNALMCELSKRDNELEQFNIETLEEAVVKKEIMKVSCSFKRVTGVLFFSFIVSIPVVLSAEPSTFKGLDRFYSTLILLMVGLPLLHSFRSGWTLSRSGIVTVTEDAFSFTIMQLFYGYVFCLTLLFTVARWS
jgi:hypothetical protein